MEKYDKLPTLNSSNRSGVLKATKRACGVAALLALIPATSFALALGKVSTTSYLGERLSVEIPILEATATEISSLKASIASPSVFSSLGIDYHPGLVGAEVSVLKGADGKQFIRIVTPSTVNDPFVNLVVVATWSSGRVVRDYSLLLDPPEIARNTGTVTAPTKIAVGETASAPVPVAAPVAVPVAVPATPSSPSVATAAAAPKSVDTASKPGTATTVVKAASEEKPKAVAATDKQITVAPGMTAGGIAASLISNGISLDQMLVALLQANPGAFINGNVNLIRAGAVLSVPTNDQLASVAASDASKIITVETKNFDEYKKRLAENVKSTNTNTAKLSDSGKVEPKVSDTKAQSAQPDKLLLSNADKNTKSNESKLAEKLQTKEDTARRDTLKENLAELKKMAADVAPASSTVAATKPVATPVDGASTVLATQAASVGATKDVVANPSASVAVTANPVVPVVKAGPVVNAKEDQSSFVSELLDNPLLAPVAGAVLALLAGLVYFRRSRQKTMAVDPDDSSFAESRLHQDSFFAESGGQTVDTQFATRATTTTDTYTTTQMSSTTDIDPIAEADVYLAYGRDMQAEEILKDAMVLQPTRLAIPLKLMELYAKHGESNEFEKLYIKLQGQTSPTDPEYMRANDLRKVLQSNIKSSSESSEREALSQMNGGGLSSQSSRSADGVPSERSIWFESDLSSSLQADHSGFANSKLGQSTIPAAQVENSKPLTAVVAEPKRLPEVRGPLDFDLSALSLDLNTEPGAASRAPLDTETLLDPWLTKLALAREYIALGDLANARKMLQEVLLGGDVTAKTEAQTLLNDLG